MTMNMSFSAAFSFLIMAFFLPACSTSDVPVETRTEYFSSVSKLEIITIETGDPFWIERQWGPVTVVVDETYDLPAFEVGTSDEVVSSKLTDLGFGKADPLQMSAGSIAYTPCGGGGPYSDYMQTRKSPSSEDYIQAAFYTISYIQTPRGCVEGIESTPKYFTYRLENA